MTAGVAEKMGSSDSPAIFPATPHLTARICAMLLPNFSPRHRFCVRVGRFPDGGSGILAGQKSVGRTIFGLSQLTAN